MGAAFWLYAYSLLIVEQGKIFLFKNYVITNTLSKYAYVSSATYIYKKQKHILRSETTVAWDISGKSHLGWKQ